MTPNNVRYLVFDVFGTVVDWRGSLIDEISQMAKQKKVDIDPESFVDEWKSCYRPGMDRVNRGEDPWTNVDVIYRRKLDQMLDDRGHRSISDEQRTHLNLAWTRLKPWPDSVSGLRRLKSKFVLSTLSNGNFIWLVEMAKFAGLPWDCVLTAENARRYKPAAEVYQLANELFGGDPSRIMLVAAHNYDLSQARRHGMQTAFIARPTEYGPGQTTDLEAEDDWNIVADDMDALADSLGA